MKPLMMLLLLFSLISCAQKEDDESSSSSTADSSGYTSCSVTTESFSFCLNYSQTSNTSAQVKAACDESSGTAIEGSCPTSLNAQSSTGICTVENSGVTLSYRYYFGDASLEEQACGQLGAGGASTTWTLDGGFLTTQSFYCRFQNDQKENCSELKNVSEENALNFCDTVNGYLDTTCD